MSNCLFVKYDHHYYKKIYIFVHRDLTENTVKHLGWNFLRKQLTDESC